MDRREGRAAAPEARATPDSPTTTPADLAAAGLRHLRAERFLEAQICCQQALAIDPDHADSLHLMGLLSIQGRHYDHAVEWIARAIRQQPRPEYLVTLGRTLQLQGRHEDALKTFDKAVQLRPEDAELWKHLGNALVDLKRPQDALLSFQRALKLNPEHFNAAYQCGVLLGEAGRLEDALASFRLCQALQPDDPAGLTGLTRCLIGLKQLDAALSENQQAYQRSPGNAAACDNIGVVLDLLGREDEALPWFDRALALQPDFVDALNDRGLVLARLQRFEESAADYRGAETLDPGNAAATLGLSHLHLLRGDFEAGWVGYAARLKLNCSVRFLQPMWLGAESVEGKTILIYGDEGLGDSIQFARYIPALAARGARVILAVGKPARALLSGVSGVAQCLEGSVDEPFDLHCPISGLPVAFATRLDTIPADVPYLPAPPDHLVQAWQTRLGPHDRLRVGLVWAGNPDHKNDHNRSSSLRAFSAMFDVDATFVSLQKDPRPDDKAVLAERNDIVDLTAHLTDFVETSALLSCLDVVVTVDTSVAHLAGALGRPTWILLPYTPDFRWLLDRDDSPWYPTVRLFRQGASRDYTDVIESVRTELVALAAKHRCAAREPSGTEPPDFEAAWQRAVLLHRSGRLEEALSYFDLCNELRPNQAVTVGSRSLVLRDLKRFEEYLAGSKQAHALDPNSAEICNNVGDALLMLDRLDEAPEWFDRAFQLQPTAVFALENKAAVFRKIHRFDEVFAIYDRILPLDPTNAQTEWAAALDRLRLGDFETGWKGREARWRISKPPLRWDGPQPVWLGNENIEGKTVLIYSDEGLGDAIQFARYVPMLAARGARVVLVVQDALHSLLSAIPGVWQCLPSSTRTLPAIDLCCPINSLPLAFGTTLDTIPPPVRLSPPTERVRIWEQRLGSRDKLRVGIVWSGSLTHLNDQSRSISLRWLTPVLNIADVTWVSLQKDPRPEDKVMLLERTDIADFTTQFTDFGVTAALVQCLDLVITVDTSIAHLAGSLGCPTWILLPYTPDYRWLLDRDDSPWYPTVRLFRQGATRDYTDVIDRVRTELAALASGKGE
jgi:tetratricopeptide (TPR) repeat protein